MKSVVQRTGLSPHVIRVWERRYRAVEPGRTPTNRRLYSDADVGRLELLGAATKAGHSIGSIARLPDDQLRVLAGQTFDGVPGESRNGEARAVVDEDPCIAAAISAIRKLDGHALESVLRRASIELGSQGLLQKMVAPLAEKIGELWVAGEFTAAQEHFASGVLRSFLANLARPYSLTGHAPNLVVATPTGQLHELGAMLVAAAASGHGWRVTYLGTGLPAVEIAGGAVRTRARAVALSIVYPGDDPDLVSELEMLRRFLPEDLPIIAGGRSGACYHTTLKRIRAVLADDLTDLYRVLDQLQVPQQPVAAAP